MPICLSSIYKVKDLLAKMKGSALVIYFLAHFEPKPIANKLVIEKLVIWSMQTGYINADVKWPDFIMKNCQNM